MLPAYVANAAPVIVNYLNICSLLNIPIDQGKSLGNNELFGKSKTIRGFVFGISSALIIGLLQYVLFQANILSEYYLLEYSVSNSLLIGLLLGTGALIGDLFKSFVKRRIGIKSGKPWIIADQIDYAIGSIFLVSFFYLLPIENIIIILIISPLFSFIANILSYIAGIKKVWW